MLRSSLVALALILETGCGRTDAPPVEVVPEGHVMVTVSAASQPPGAIVTGGGAALGRTPLTTQVPVPAPTGGQPQAFEFSFQLPGFRSQTLTASPVNNTLTLNVVLQPELPVTAQVGVQPPTPPAVVAPPVVAATNPPVGLSGTTYVFEGSRGGAIRDYTTVRSEIPVVTNCVIRDLEVRLAGDHTFFRDLIVTLVGPGGDRFQLQNHRRTNPFRTHAVRRALGRPSAGMWTVAVTDDVRADGGSLRGTELRLTCR